MVQDKNCLSHVRHIWQGDTLQISARVVRTAMSAEQDHPQIGSWGNSTLASRGAKTLIKKTQEGGVHHFQGITEAGSRPLLRQPSSTYQSAAPHHADFPAIGHPRRCPTGRRTCPAAHLALEVLPCKMLTTPLPTVLTPRPSDRDSGTRVHYLPTDCYVCVIFLLDC